jgi:hypothetical protein
MIDVKLLKGEAIFQYSWGWIKEPLRIKPRDYLDFAQQDRSDGDSARHLINSVSNSKRALHLRMENLYEGFGGIAVAGKAWNFPILIDFLRKCGIVSPRILDRINRLRNAVEHEYYTPTLDEVETFLDVTELFLAATDALIGRQPSTIEFEHDAIRDHSGTLLLQEMSFDWETAQITLSFSPEDNSSFMARVRHQLDSSVDAYFECVRFAIKHSGE